jgi:hypothetical protein
MRQRRVAVPGRDGRGPLTREGGSRTWSYAVALWILDEVGAEQTAPHVGVRRQTPLLGPRRGA